MNGIESIAAERQRQIEKEGWTSNHDDTHTAGELATAAACYASPALLFIKEERATATIYRDPWPWDDEWDKRPHVGNSLIANRGANDDARRKMLVKAGALIAAEIDRLDRAAKNGDSQ